MDGDWKEGGKKKKMSVPAEIVRKRYVNDESAGVAERIGQVRRLRQKQEKGAANWLSDRWFR